MNNDEKLKLQKIRRILHITPQFSRLHDTEAYKEIDRYLDDMINEDNDKMDETVAINVPAMIKPVKATKKRNKKI